jgi:hypothetical protein
MGNTLTHTQNLSDPDGLGSFSYQWKRNGVAIHNAVLSDYTTIAADVGTDITLTISYTDQSYAGYPESVTSNSLTVVPNTVDLTLNASTSSVLEGNSFTFSITASRVISGTVDVSLTGTATSGVDYTASGATTQFTFNNSTTSDTLSISTVSDHFTDGQTETVVATITNASVTSGSTPSIVTSTQTVNITDSSLTPTPKIVLGDYAADSSRGAVFTYNLDGTSEQEIRPAFWATNQQFGAAVAVQGNKIVVGNPRYFNTSVGQAHIFNTDGTGEIKLTHNGASGEAFGGVVAMNSTKIAVSAVGRRHYSVTTGSVYMYNHDGTGRFEIPANNYDAYNNRYIGGFGWATAMIENKILIGAPTNGRHAFLCDLDGTNEIEIVDPLRGVAGTNTSTGFAKSLALSSTKMVIGAGTETDPNISPSGFGAGAAYIYNIDGSGMIKLTEPVRGYQHRFGEQVAINSNKVAVAAIDRVTGGNVYIFNFDGSLDFTIPMPTGSYYRSLAMDDNRIVVGLTTYNGSGKVLVYNLDGSNQIQINTSNATAVNQVGYSVGI